MGWIGIAATLLGSVCLLVYRNGKHYQAEARRWAEQEARASIAKLRTAEEAYRAEHGAYLATTTRGEDDFYPAPGPEPRRRLFQPRKDRRPPWALLSPAMPHKRLLCGYVVVAGPAGSLAEAGPRGRALFDHRPPSGPWYYIRARCIQGAGKVLTFESTSASTRILFRE
jgi:hypothetical protein